MYYLLICFFTSLNRLSFKKEFWSFCPWLEHLHKPYYNSVNRPPMCIMLKECILLCMGNSINYKKSIFKTHGGDDFIMNLGDSWYSNKICKKQAFFISKENYLPQNLEPWLSIYQLLIFLRVSACKDNILGQPVFVLSQKARRAYVVKHPVYHKCLSDTLYDIDLI